RMSPELREWVLSLAFPHPPIARAMRTRRVPPSPLKRRGACVTPGTRVGRVESSLPLTPARQLIPTRTSTVRPSTHGPNGAVAQDEGLFLMPSTNPFILSRARERASRRTHHAPVAALHVQRRAPIVHPRDHRVRRP